jgi:ABC-type antimicrobial peptide transport system permease subunit
MEAARGGSPASLAPKTWPQFVASEPTRAKPRAEDCRSLWSDSTLRMAAAAFVCLFLVTLIVPSIAASDPSVSYFSSTLLYPARADFTLAIRATGTDDFSLRALTRVGSSPLYASGMVHMVFVTFVLVSWRNVQFRERIA